jgi:transcription elongation factor Elf1
VSAEPEETSSEEGLICPYCGQTDLDAWELQNGSECGETDCGSCGREFRWSTYTSITYYGKPMKKEGE